MTIFKRYWGLTLILFLGCGSQTSFEVRPAAIITEDPGTDVTRIFAAKCAICHGSDLAHPEGRFGYVLDLPKIRSNPEIVIPGSPSESELWILVERCEMPPADSPNGLLSPEEQRAIKAWIIAGAPDALKAPEFGKQHE